MMLPGRRASQSTGICPAGAKRRNRDKTSSLNLHDAIFLFFAGALGGGINAVAGGGSFVSFPALLFTGVPPVPANATNTLALWVGTTASGRVINGVATLTFIAAGVILWPRGIVMTVGAILGGYSSAHYAQKLPQAWVRAFIILVGTAMTIYFFIRGYR